MKKLISLLTMLLLTVTVFGQHLKFMGIPLDGSITTFHQKLVQKGFKPDVDFNKKSAVGSRAFYGIFCGEEAEIYVYYNPKTKIVYRAKACIDNENEDLIKLYYDDIKEMITNKYIYFNVRNGQQNGYESTIYRIFQNDNEEGTVIVELGTIGLYLSTFTEYYPTKYTLHVDYTDNFNSLKNDSSNMDDL